MEIDLYALALKLRDPARMSSTKSAFFKVGTASPESA
jgi:hypothetical protein